MGSREIWRPVRSARVTPLPLLCHLPKDTDALEDPTGSFLTDYIADTAPPPPAVSTQASQGEGASNIGPMRLNRMAMMGLVPR